MGINIRLFSAVAFAAVVEIAHAAPIPFVAGCAPASIARRAQVVLRLRVVENDELARIVRERFIPSVGEKIGTLVAADLVNTDTNSGLRFSGFGAGKDILIRMEARTARSSPWTTVQPDGTRELRVPAGFSWESLPGEGLDLITGFLFGHPLYPLQIGGSVAARERIEFPARLITWIQRENHRPSNTNGRAGSQALYMAIYRSHNDAAAMDLLQRMVVARIDAIRRGATGSELTDFHIREIRAAVGLPELPVVDTLADRLIVWIQQNLVRPTESDGPLAQEISLRLASNEAEAFRADVLEKVRLNREGRENRLTDAEVLLIRVALGLDLDADELGLAIVEFARLRSRAARPSQRRSPEQQLYQRLSTLRTLRAPEGYARFRDGLEAHLGRLQSGNEAFRLDAVQLRAVREMAGMDEFSGSMREARNRQFILRVIDYARTNSTPATSTSSGEGLAIYKAIGRREDSPVFPLPQIQEALLAKIQEIQAGPESQRLTEDQIRVARLSVRLATE